MTARVTFPLNAFPDWYMNNTSIITLVSDIMFDKHPESGHVH